MVRVVHPFRLEARDQSVDLQTEQRGGETRGGVWGGGTPSFELPSRVVDLEGFPEELGAPSDRELRELGRTRRQHLVDGGLEGGGLDAAVGLLQTFELEGDFGEEPGAGGAGIEGWRGSGEGGGEGTAARARWGAHRLMRSWSAPWADAAGRRQQREAVARTSRGSSANGNPCIARSAAESDAARASAVAGVSAAAGRPLRASLTRSGRSEVRASNSAESSDGIANGKRVSAASASVSRETISPCILAALRPAAASVVVDARSSRACRLAGRAHMSCGVRSALPSRRRAARLAGS